MKNLADAKHFFNEGYKEYRPGLTVDCAILGYRDGELKLLLIKNKFSRKWCLPGGFIKKEETLENSAARVTLERTGIGNLFLKQYKVFGDPGRNRSTGDIDYDKLNESLGIKIETDSWLAIDTVSIGYYAITDIANTNPVPDFFSIECDWLPINDLPDLGYDHKEMVKEALFAMRIDLYHFPIGKSLLQPKFTLKEVKTLYEVLTSKKLNHTNFPNKLIALGLISKMEEKKNIGAHRAPAFYSFNADSYEKALNEGVVLV